VIRSTLVAHFIDDVPNREFKSADAEEVDKTRNLRQEKKQLLGS